MIEVFAEVGTSHPTSPYGRPIGLMSQTNISVTELSTLQIAKQVKLDAIARAAQDEIAAVSNLTRDKVLTKLLAEQIDTNKFLRDQNRMIRDLLQAQRPKS